MLSFATNHYRVEVADSSVSITNSDFLNHFDHVYMVSDEYGPTSGVSIRVYEDDALVKRVLFGASGGGTGVYPTSIIFKGDSVVGCCGDHVFCIHIPELELTWSTRADDATCFEIFSYGEDYIVHGELGISRLDHLGNIVWQRGGADIFATPGGKDTFVLTNEYIIAKDWNYDVYKFDFDGNLIT
jgi:hypothetical protein